MRPRMDPRGPRRLRVEASPPSAAPCGRWTDWPRPPGGARYTDDIRLPGMLHGKILRSPHPHARIEAIDTSRAEALEGVHAVVTGRDMPTTFGIIPWTPDEYPLCVDRVRYIGDGVAAVAALDEDTAIAALDLIDVTYEELPAYLTRTRPSRPRPGRTSTSRASRGGTGTSPRCEA